MRTSVPNENEPEVQNFGKFFKITLDNADKYSTMKQTVEDLFVLLVVAGMCVLAAMFVQFLKGIV